jgi:hypothetical protein
MRIRIGIMVVTLALLAYGCQMGMTGIVVDAETGKPVEGAVVLVEWTKTHGLGLKSTSSYKVVETLTDKDGRFSVTGVLNPFVNEPNLTVYKKGYIAWNSRIIFPDYRNRQGFEWKDGFVFELERFDEKSSSYDKLSSFISSAARLSSASEKKRTFYSQIEWTRKKASFEWRKKREEGKQQ